MLIRLPNMSSVASSPPQDLEQPSLPRTQRTALIGQKLPLDLGSQYSACRTFSLRLIEIGGEADCASLGHRLAHESAYSPVYVLELPLSLQVQRKE